MDVRLFDMSALDDLFKDLPMRLDADQAAEVIGITGSTIRRLIADKSDPDPLPAYRVGRSWMVLRDDFKEWLLRHRSNTSI